MLPNGLSEGGPSGAADKAWREWLATQRIAAVDLASLSGRGVRLVVVAPHPDDEVLGCGGLLATWGARRSELRVVTVSDGEASHPDNPAWPPRHLAATRRAEQAKGLAKLGVGEQQVIRLHLPDGALGEHRRDLHIALLEIIGDADVVVTTWRADGHPDHEATGEVAAEVCLQRKATLLEMPVWMWNWAEPSDPRVPWHRLRSVELTPSAVAAKCAALAEHRTQLEFRRDQPPVLGTEILSRATRDVEYFFV